MEEVNESLNYLERVRILEPWHISLLKSCDNPAFCLRLTLFNQKIVQEKQIMFIFDNDQLKR
jgi:hypothetical protein